MNGFIVYGVSLCGALCAATALCLRMLSEMFYSGMRKTTKDAWRLFLSARGECVHSETRGWNAVVLGTGVISHRTCKCKCQQKR